ncbi:MAG TPA: NADH-quinone oxidoreductase subunit J [Thermomicrobiaceae bacterium]|nr:NADH-quinone oxidoreductase subunit J [Thermomicrobiaceae bacterium]
MSAEVVVFDILSVIAVLAAIGVVLARNPVHSAASLVVTFVNLAAIYVMLRADFLAVVQVIVYTGAILVLVLFVIMLVHQEDLPEFHGGRPVQRAAGFILGLILLGEVAAAVLTRSASVPSGPWTPAAVQSAGGNVQALGQVLYSGYVLPIQATALVLLVATVGALVLARPDLPRLRSARRETSTISLGHPRGTDVEPQPTALPAVSASQVKPETGERELVMAKSGDEFVDHPVWGERREP